MSSGLKQRIAEAARTRGRGLEVQEVICSHRGPALRTVERECCGGVDVFYCSALGREVENTKCRRCPMRRTPQIGGGCGGGYA